MRGRGPVRAGPAGADPAAGAGVEAGWKHEGRRGRPAGAAAAPFAARGVAQSCGTATTGATISRVRRGLAVLTGSSVA